MSKPPPPMHEERCPACKYLLFIGRISPGTRIEIKCPKCRNPKPVIVIEQPAAGKMDTSQYKGAGRRT